MIVVRHSYISARRQGAVSGKPAKLVALGKALAQAMGPTADVVLLRGLDIAAIPAADLHGAIVASAHGANVDTVIVDGEIVKRDGKLVGIDRAAVAGALAESRARLLDEAGAGTG